MTILAPYVAPVPHTQALSAISFEGDKKRPTRVDNEAKAQLDAVALSLQQQPDAKVVLVGNATAEEKMPPKHHKKHAKMEDLAAQRAVNVKEYLVTEKGIDASRITGGDRHCRRQDGESLPGSRGSRLRGRRLWNDPCGREHVEGCRCASP